MGYIPKYILKRMIPKKAVKIDGDQVTVTVVNVMSPIPVEEIPDDIINYFSIKINGEEVAGPSKPEESKVIELSVLGETYTLDNMQDLLGKTIPVGEQAIFKMPNPGVAAGDEVNVDVEIKTDNPLIFSLKRTIQE